VVGWSGHPVFLILPHKILLSGTISEKIHETKNSESIFRALTRKNRLAIPLENVFTMMSAPQ
jgi:hypothetical protein